MNLLAENLDQRGHERQRRQGQERQPPVELEHQADGHNHRHRRARRVHDAGTHEVPDRVQVVRELRHQVAGPRRDVKALGEAAEVTKEVVAQVVFHIARDADQDPAHPELEDGFRERDAQQHEGENEQLVANYAAGSGCMDQQMAPRVDRRQCVNAAFDDQRHGDADRLRYEQGDKAHDVTLAAAGEVRSEWA